MEISYPVCISVHLSSHQISLLIRKNLTSPRTISYALRMTNTLHLDRRDVALWLSSRHPAVQHELSVSCNYTTPPDVIAHVVVLTDGVSRDRRHELRDDAIRALNALGYTLEPAGGDVYDVFVEQTADMTDEQWTACIQRVDLALTGRPIPDPLELADYSATHPARDDF